MMECRPKWPERCRHPFRWIYQDHVAPPEVVDFLHEAVDFALSVHCTSKGVDPPIPPFVSDARARASCRKSLRKRGSAFAQICSGLKSLTVLSVCLPQSSVLQKELFCECLHMFQALELGFGIKSFCRTRCQRPNEGACQWIISLWCAVTSMSGRFGDLGRCGAVRSLFRGPPSPKPVVESADCSIIVLMMACEQARSRTDLEK